MRAVFERIEKVPKEEIFTVSPATSAFETLRKHRFDKLRRFVARQADFAENRFSQVHAGQSLVTHGCPLRVSRRRMSPQEMRVNNNGLGRAVDAHYQRRTTDPQARPPPIASVTRRSPWWIWPRALPTESASGIEAAEVLP